MVGASAAGLVSAQPAPPAPPVLVTPPPAPTPGPGGPAEEAPPVNVPTPAPMVVPPISEKEVAPAPPPKPKVEEKPAEQVRRARYDVAILQALDKVTAESLRFEAPVGRPVRYKSLVFTVRACERSASDEAVEDSVVYMTIDSQPRPAPGKPTPPARQAFKGWMYASSPGLHPLEHPVYDAWLITCRAAAPLNAPAPIPVAAPATPAPKATPAAAPAAAKAAPTAPVTPKLVPPAPEPAAPAPPPPAEPEVPPT
ncbi:DUF2155 domain-containing protein [Phenylobacterium hankyongense]|uniref:DUF2155 domain-containing protein n=1 Tax=Phenylobacterium hankyongense TaxID=1813876 RepID=UPI003C778E09